MHVLFTFFLEPITFIDTQVIQSVKENDEAIIKCMVTGDPDPSLSWYYNGLPINRKFYSRNFNKYLLHRLRKYCECYS